MGVNHIPCGRAEKVNRESRRSFLKRLGGVAAVSVAARTLPAAEDAPPLGLPELASRPSTSQVAEAAKSLVADIRAPEVVDGQTIHEPLLGEMLNEAGLDANQSRDRLCVNVSPEDLKEHRELLSKLIQELIEEQG